MHRPYRSVLYVPASNARAMEKARTLDADALIFDLEDAVVPSEKERARDLLHQALLSDYGRRVRIVRINGLGTDWGMGDARAFGKLADVVLVSKVNRSSDLDKVASVVPDAPIWAMMETAEGILNAAEIARHRRLEGLMMGTNDLARELFARYRPDRLPLMGALQACVLAARAYGRIIIDGTFNKFDDPDGLRAEAEQGRDLGFDGKSVIHPDQIAVANKVFVPSSEDVDLARRQIAAFEAARAQNKGVGVLDGSIVESLHVRVAERILSRADAVAGQS